MLWNLSKEGVEKGKAVLLPASRRRLILPPYLLLTANTKPEPQPFPTDGYLLLGSHFCTIQPPTEPPSPIHFRTIQPTSRSPKAEPPSPIHFRTIQPPTEA